MFRSGGTRKPASALARAARETGPETIAVLGSGDAVLSCRRSVRAEPIGQRYRGIAMPIRLALARPSRFLRRALASARRRRAMPSDILLSLPVPPAGAS